ncbi:MAG: autorepressor SdpR family transcription factor [Anaerolineales bacterium]|jgi:DNA-binding transcriptional ArsR family regulator
MAVNEVFKALSDPTRREILRLLRTDDLPAGEIASRFDASWPTISHHLGVLKDANLVLVERQAQSLIYSLNATVLQEALAELMGWFGKKQDHAD